MKITKAQLKQLIREAVVKQLNESPKSESQKAYDKMKRLKKKYGSLLRLADKLTSEDIENIFQYKASAESYSDFYSSVGPKAHKREGGFKPANDYRLMPEEVHQLWNLKADADEVVYDLDLYQSMKDRFVSRPATSQTDMVYGRKRREIIDTHTGEVVSSTTDRKGSLGT